VSDFDSQTGIAADIVCGLGASAGGLAPIEEFFDAMPSGTGAAFVLVQHLSPDHESMMVSLLSGHTDMPVLQAEHGALVQRDHVYVISPGTELAVHKNRFKVSSRDFESREITRPIDVFFKSMASGYGTRCAAVVLSGTGSDGTLGIESVRRAGGITLAQDDSAAFEGMPTAAQRSGFVDSVNSPAALAAIVEEFARSGDRPGSEADGVLEPEEVRILALLARSNDIDFREYKPATIHRRLKRRLQMSGLASMDEYTARLRERVQEREDLIDDLFIDVTSFFRDPDAYLLIDNEVMPNLAQQAADEGRPIRIWVPGCATGEEAYSLTMLAMEAAERVDGTPPAVQTFATDVHGAALDTASAGAYSDDRMEAVSPARRQRFFERTNAGWVAKKELRSAITLARHNLLTDAPFTRVDLVSCRNLLIYFKNSAQERAVASMGFALRHGGVLFLGSSETVGFAAPDYERVSSTWRIYRKLSDNVERNFRRTPPMRTDISIAGRRTMSSSADLTVLRAYDEILNDQFAAGLLINDRRHVVYVMGKAKTWLEHSVGRPTNDVLSLVADSALRLTIGSTLRELEAGADEATPRPLGAEYVDDDGNTFALLGRRIESGSNRPHFLVYVAPTVAPVEVPTGPPTSLAGGLEHETALTAMEAELRHNRESLQAALEEQETSNEELNAANEELIASNEELQSTNEELSSVNEELRTLNDEHQRRLDQVLELTADLEQLMSSTEIAVVFLSEERAVRRFNEPARDYFRIRDNDIGRPFDDILSTLTYPELAQDIDDAFESGAGRSRAVRSTTYPGKRLLAQVSRYELPRNRSGVLVAVVDITDVEIADEERVLATTMRSVPSTLIVWDDQSNIVYANDSAREMLGAPESAELAGTPLSAWMPEAEVRRAMFENQEVLRTGDQRIDVKAIHDTAAIAIKFPVSFDGVPHVGGVALRMDDALGHPELQQLRVVQSAVVGAVDLFVVDPSGHLSHRSGPQVAHLPANVFDLDEMRECGLRSELHKTAVTEAIRTGEHRFVRDRLQVDGRRGWLQFQYVPLTEDLSAIGVADSSVVCIAMNVNEVSNQLDAARSHIAQLSVELGDLRASTDADVALLAERNQDLDNFAHVAAHDLKAPIRSVRSFAEIALSELEDGSAARPHIAQVIESAQRMGQLVDSLLDFAAIGRESFEPHRIDLNALVDEVAIDLRSAIDDGDAVITRELPVTHIEGNVEAIRQVVANLVQNSLKFTGDVPAVIDIRSGHQDDGVVISVEDNGVGFPVSEASRLFEPFQRLHAVEKPGSGVGLAICRRIVQRHGGRIWASSEEGRGANFSFWLPEQQSQ